MDIDNDLSRILRSNDAPTPIETTSIRSEVEIIIGKISLLHAELQGLEEQLRERQGALSPVRRLPPEILAEIFSSSVEGILDSEGRDALLDLGLVCKNWRRASLGSHRLWASISVDRHQCNETSYQKIVAWLNRSGDLPKTFMFDHIDLDYCECEDHDPAEEPCQMSNPALIKLLSVGPKLHKLVLRCSSHLCFRTLLENIGPEPDLMNPRPWDTLQSLELELATADSSPWDEPLEASKSLFYHLPQVKSLELHIPWSSSAFEGDPSDTKTVALNVPPRLLQGLKAFTLHCDWQGSHILSMLQHCENLETLGVDFRGEALQYDEDDVLVHKFTASRLLLPKLHTIRLQYTTIENTAILDFLRAPSLRNLRLDMEYSHAHQAVEFQKPLLNFIKASNCERTLQSFHLQNLSLPAMKLAHVLLDLPLLTTVIIDHRPLDGETFWRQMHYHALKSRRNGESPLCLPRLQELQTLYVPVDGRAVVRAVAKFLRENREINDFPCTWKVSHRTAMPMQAAIEGKLAELEEYGVSFQILPLHRWFLD
ncbi:hypothetical protein DFP72DRAFT_1074130 [Ephemerocybe angulata]|uniref:F-box domain-containing protein n=1 Tax=Ephemerocybe angulata TaxID=980116 RepID=A0A8H6HLA2_9AGAR|nr:hypothetical protein DFP72DRAFT_1074130 [Tulosesus angulatus]